MNPHGLWVRDLENPLYLRCVKHIVNVMTHIVSCPDVWSGCCGSCNKGHASLKATGSSRYMIFLTSRPPTDWWFFVSWNQKGMKWKNRIYYFYIVACLFRWTGCVAVWRLYRPRQHVCAHRFHLLCAMYQRWYSDTTMCSWLLWIVSKLFKMPSGSEWRTNNVNVRNGDDYRVLYSKWNRFWRQY